MPEYVIGVDGGNSKTDVAVATVSGRLLARVRGPGVRSPLRDPAGWAMGLVACVQQACAEAGMRGQARCAAYFLANVDVPAERRIAQRALTGAGLAATTTVHNDCLAVLRAGVVRPWGVAVVAGAGLNAVGVHPSGRVSGFLSLGRISGDNGGGMDLGLSALGAAMRAQDGRGPATVLARAVPAHFGLHRPSEVALAVHEGRIEVGGLLVLAPLVLAAAAERDAVAARLVGDLADEVTVLAVTLLRRLRLVRSDAEVVLGGGLLQGAAATGAAVRGAATTGAAVRGAAVRGAAVRGAATATLDGVPPGLVEQATAAILRAAPRAQVRVLDAPPVYGALAEALREVGAGPAAGRRARDCLIGGSLAVRWVPGR